MPVGPDRPQEERSRGQVYTFYSFKGGVGRSMALANTAALLARWGRSVLIVDFDLEAPGIEKFFERWTFGSRKSSSGLVDIFTEFAKGNRLEWQSCLLKVSLPEAQPIHVLTAGRDDGDYGTRLRSISWERLFAQQQFGAFLEALRQQWTSEYDFVLVDSRTGITDIGGICTIHLPDVLLTLFTTTDQGLKGVKEVMEKSRQAHGALPVDRRRLLLVPVPARDESRTEYKLAAEWRARFAAELGPFYDDWIPKDETAVSVLDLLKIPYVAFWSFGERLPVLEEDLNNPDKLAFFYQLLGRLILGQLDLREVRRGSLASEGMEAQKAETVMRLHEAELTRQKAQREIAEQEAAQRERDRARLQERYENYLATRWSPAVHGAKFAQSSLLVIAVAFVLGAGAPYIYPQAFGGAGSHRTLIAGVGLMAALTCLSAAVALSRKASRLQAVRARFDVERGGGTITDEALREFADRAEGLIQRPALSWVLNPGVNFADGAAAVRTKESPAPGTVGTQRSRETTPPAAFGPPTPTSLPPPVVESSVPPSARSLDEDYDVYISYEREQFTGEWLNEFMPLLLSWLSDTIGRPAKIFVAVPMLVGEPLDEIERVLRRSRVLLAIVTTTYVKSEYSMRELDVFAATGRRIVPVLLRGSIEVLPPHLREFRVADFREFAIIGEGFRKAVQYVDFQTAIRHLAEQVAEQLPDQPYKF